MEFQPANRIASVPKNFFAKLDQVVAGLPDQAAVIDLTKGNPDLRTPEPIVKALQHASTEFENDRYTDVAGKASLRQAIAQYYQRLYGVIVDPDTQILATNGSCISLSALPQVFLNPGDYVITTDPCYPEYYATVAQAGGKLYQLPINEANHFLPDLDSVPDEILSKARILLLNYPNNPTGATATTAFFQQAIAFGRQHHLLVVNDFAYAAIGFDQAPISILAQPGATDVAIELNTLSKTYNMAGWRVGYTLGNASAMSALKAYHEHTYSTIYGAVQDAAIVGLRGNQASVAAIRKTYQQRRDVMCAGLDTLGWHYVLPQGAFYLWIHAPEGLSGDVFTQLLLQQVQVVVAPGIGFGAEGQYYVRISLTQPLTVLETVLQRFRQV